MWLPTPTRSNLRDTHDPQAVIWAPPASSGGSVRRSVNRAAERPSPGAAPRVSRYQPLRHSCCQHPLPVACPAPSTGTLMKLRSAIVISVLIPVTTSDRSLSYQPQAPGTPTAPPHRPSAPFGSLSASSLRAPPAGQGQASSWLSASTRPERRLLSGIEAPDLGEGQRGHDTQPHALCSHATGHGLSA